MKIVVDAMGGDHAPEAIIEGAVMAAKEYGTEIILTGISDTIHTIWHKLEPERKLPIQVVHAEEVVEMNDIPGKVLRSKRQSSMKVGLDLVKDGAASAFVSAGNTGAVLAYSTVILRPLKGVDRPAIAIQLPTLKGNAILLDAGANVDCKTSQLFQFGIMGHVFAEYILGKEDPRVGLLSIGEEDGKGNEIVKETFQMLKSSHINFIGNIEGKEVYRGNADVIVCDGFTGNVALKISESVAEMIGTNLKRMFQANLFTKLGYLLLKSQLNNYKKKVDYSETGGAPLLGVNGVVIIAHGSSSPKAIKNAISRANELSEKNITQHIMEDIESNLTDVEAAKGTIWNQIKSMAFGSESEVSGEGNPTTIPPPESTDQKTDEKP
jgi:phosphate acyltransferase